MAAEVKSPSGVAKLTGLANFLGPPKLLGRDDKVATLVIKVDEGSPHLKIIDQGVCLKCIEKPCTVTCPVENYKVEENGHTTIYWSNCIECGTCNRYCEMGIDIRLRARQGIPLRDTECVACGACIAVCPRYALSFHPYPTAEEALTPLATGRFRRPFKRQLATPRER